MTPDQTTVHECHGTGTALGDPIEVGSSRIVNDPYERQVPLMLQAAKTQVGHLELGSGTVGALRAVTMLMNSTVPPNGHIHQLNEHFALEGFPVSMPCEACPSPNQSWFLGVNSFGFGGTNARAELWGRSKRESADSAVPKMEKIHFITVPCPRCLGSMCWLCGVAIPRSAAFRGKHRCSAIRDDSERYDFCSNCFEGEYLHGGPNYADVGNPGGLKVHITGSWNAWSGLEEMLPVEEEEGVYRCAVRLGDTRCERFYLLVDADPGLAVFPVVDGSGQAARILGPERNEERRGWLIDGYLDDMPEGAVYQVTFTWPQEAGAWKQIAWEPTEEVLPNLSVHGSHPRAYAILGSWAAWRPEDMCATAPGFWEATAKIGAAGAERFCFLRDRDKAQALYPAEPDAAAAPVPVLGPDGARQGRSWLLRGAPGSERQIRLGVRSGHWKVTVAAPEGETSWESAPRQYCVAGSWAQGGLDLMRPDLETPGVYKCWITIGEGCREEFQILVDQDPGKRIYPAFAGAPPGHAIVRGPDAAGEGLHWEVFGRPGQQLELVLDLQAEDRRAAVTCRPWRP